MRRNLSWCKNVNDDTILFTNTLKCTKVQLQCTGGGNPIWWLQFTVNFIFVANFNNKESETPDTGREDTRLQNKVFLHLQTFKTLIMTNDNCAYYAL